MPPDRQAASWTSGLQSGREHGEEDELADELQVSISCSQISLEVEVQGSAEVNHQYWALSTADLMGALHGNQADTQAVIRPSCEQ